MSTGVWTASERPTEAEDARTGPGDYVACTAEVAECTCPEYCERDHENE